MLEWDESKFMSRLKIHERHAVVRRCFATLWQWADEWKLIEHKIVDWCITCPMRHWDTYSIQFRFRNRICKLICCKSVNNVCVRKMMLENTIYRLKSVCETAIKSSRIWFNCVALCKWPQACSRNVCCQITSIHSKFNWLCHRTPFLFHPTDRSLSNSCCKMSLVLFIHIKNGFNHSPSIDKKSRKIHEAPGTTCVRDIVFFAIHY